MTTFAFTGHTPKKLYPYGDYSDRCLQRLTALAVSYLSARYDVSEIWCGGSQGWDFAAAHAAQILTVPYRVALPHKSWGSQWREARDRKMLEDILFHAEEVIVVCDGEYTNWMPSRRNEHMIDNSDRVVALWNRKPGGTTNAVMYANRTGTPVDNLWGSWVKHSGFGPAPAA